MRLCMFLSADFGPQGVTCSIHLHFIWTVRVLQNEGKWLKKGGSIIRTLVLGPSGGGGHLFGHGCA